MESQGVTYGGNSYYDCQAILAEETMVPVDFLTSATGVGQALDPSSDAADLQRGARVEVPFWMVKGLTDRNMASLRMPKCFGPKLRKKVKAGAQFVDLRSACPHFYDFGIMINNIIVDEELPTFLNSTFQVRYAELLLSSQTHDPRTADQDHMRLKAKLTVEERQLYDAGCAGMDELDRWRYSQTLAGRKRKFHIGTD